MPALLLALILACGGTTMSTDGWDKTCEAPVECLAVTVGEVCGCSCEPGVINASQEEEWNAERNEILESCAEVYECAPCPDVEVTCEDGLCEVVD